MTRLADDRRARVPFALAGVLLLLGAATFAAAVSTRGPGRVDRDVDAAMERTSSGTTAVLRSAVAEAARAAAAEPVTAPAATPYGRLLNGSRPFRDALRLRIYLTLQDRLPATRYRRRDVTAVASLPEPEGPTDLRRALDRIAVTGVSNGTALRVTVRNLTVTAREGKRVVARERRTRTLTVATPVLALHDRTTRFERRLNRGPLDGPGLGRRLTARLYPIAWARGYAQRAGLPVANVVANRHVEVTTGGAILSTQRAVFGRSDPDGRRSTRRAMAALGVRDVAASTPLSAWTEQVLPRPNARSTTSLPLPQRRGQSAPSPDRRISVDAGSTARRTLAGLGSDAIPSNRSLSDVFRAVYRVETRLRTSVEQTYAEPRPEPTPPGDEWSLGDTEVSTTVETDPSPGPTPSVAGDERRFLGYGRLVTLTHRVRWTWKRGTDEIHATGSWTERYRVGVTLAGEYAPRGPAPDRPTSPTFERGGPLGGPNLADVPDKAESRLIDAQGGRSAVAVAVVRGQLGATSRVVHGDRPDQLRAWVWSDIAPLRDRLAGVSVPVRAGRLATYTANPPARLATLIGDRRSKLVAPPARYNGTADRARIAARMALVNGTVDRLDARAATHRDTRRAFGRVLGRAGIRSPEALARVADVRERVRRPDRFSLGGGSLGGDIELRPDGSPAYLTVASVGHDRAHGVPPDRPYHPLAAGNVNVFAAPYGSAADAVTASAEGRSGDGRSRGRLRTAARVLAASDRVAVADGSNLREDRSRLRTSVSSAVGRLRRRTRRAVHRETELSRPASDAAVEAAFERWDDPQSRALAATNGSLARAVAVEADRRMRGSSVSRIDRLETHLQSAFNGTRRTTVPDASIRPVAVDIRQSTVDGRQAALADLPAGLPVSPVPGYWYATVNVWKVSVRGAYARFTLRTDRGVTTPDPATAVRYVRDGSTVELDVDDDGDRERLGRDERVSFDTGTTVAIAVPAPDFVGDTEGGRNETSAGWPTPRCTSWEPLECPSE